jgi:perosamine synthetase
MKTSTLTDQPLALKGGPKVLETPDPPELFHWPIVTEEDEQAIVGVLRRGEMSSNGTTIEFEKAWGEYLGTEHNLGHCNGTAAIMAAMWAVGLRRGDEMIAPSFSYWATALQSLGLGATAVFADIDPHTLNIDPGDIEHRITARTKAITVVHQCGYPCDMDAIMAIARRHGLKVIEDNSHAHGSLYKGRKTGSIGDVGAMSMMSKKSFCIGEAGMLSTNDRSIYEHALAFGQYARMHELTDPALARFAGLPLGGFKFRMNQWSSAMGLVQLKHYPQRIAEIDSAMNRFWDLLEAVPGLRDHRPAKDSGLTKGGWYNPVGIYEPEALGGLPLDKFLEALKAEGSPAAQGITRPMHLHPVFQEADVYGDGKPSAIAFADRDVRQRPGSLPTAEKMAGRVIAVPYFKHDWPDAIERHAAAFRKVVEHAGELGA